MLHNLKKKIVNAIQFIKDSMEKSDLELEKLKEEDPDFYFEYLFDIYDKKP